MLRSALKAWLQIGPLDQLGYLNFRKVREQIVRKSVELFAAAARWQTAQLTFALILLTLIRFCRSGGHVEPSHVADRHRLAERVLGRHSITSSARAGRELSFFLPPAVV